MDNQTQAIRLKNQGQYKLAIDNFLKCKPHNNKEISKTLDEIAECFSLLDKHLEAGYYYSLEYERNKNFEVLEKIVISYLKANNADFFIKYLKILVNEFYNNSDINIYCESYNNEYGSKEDLYLSLYNYFSFLISINNEVLDINNNYYDLQLLIAETLLKLFHSIKKIKKTKSSRSNEYNKDNKDNKDNNNNNDNNEERSNTISSITDIIYEEVIFMKEIILRINIFKNENDKAIELGLSILNDLIKLEKQEKRDKNTNHINYNKFILFYRKDCHHALGIAYYNLKKAEEAIYHYNRVNSLEEFDNSYAGLALCYYHINNDYEKAIENIDKAILLNPKDIYYYYKENIFLKKSNSDVSNSTHNNHNKGLLINNLINHINNKNNDTKDINQLALISNNVRNPLSSIEIVSNENKTQTRQSDNTTRIDGDKKTNRNKKKVNSCCIVY